ncbi:SoxR reducing system RseC family protein [candidate division WOR-3 bacterium]|nr:SoxR reducing system RseC family protein [candidate division WOR-3 bacterium]
MEEKGIIQEILNDGRYAVRFYVNPEACSCCSAYGSCVVKKNQELVLSGPSGLRVGQEVKAVFPVFSKSYRLLLIFGSPVAVFLTVFLVLQRIFSADLPALTGAFALSICDFIVMLIFSKKMEKKIIKNISISATS